MSENEINDVITFVKDKVPMIYDMEKDDLKYDSRNMYYKTMKCILILKDRVKELEKDAIRRDL